jgi:class 3 adenylate cyclase
MRPLPLVAKGRLLAKEAPSVESGVAAILAADVVCYSRLMLGGEEAMTTTLSARASLVDELIGRHRGSDREHSHR